MKNKHFYGKRIKVLARLFLGIICLFLTIGALKSDSKTKVTGGAMMAFVLVASLKSKGIYDKLDENTKAFVDGLEKSIQEEMENFQKGLINQKGLDDKLEQFKNSIGKTLTEEQHKEFTDMIESVKSQAVEIQKLKDNGFSAEEVFPFSIALKKAMKDNEEKFKSFHTNRTPGNGFEFSFKTAAAMGIGSNLTGAANYLPTPQIQQGLMEAPRNKPFILDFCDVESTNSALIVWFNKINRDGGAAYIAEGNLKPLSDFDVQSETSKPKKVAHAFNVSEEMLMDLPFIEGEIRKEGIATLELKIEDGIINGDGLVDNLKGILAYATAYALPALDDTVNNANNYDALMAAHTQLVTLNFTPNVVFVHPVERFKLRTMKTTQDVYIIPPSGNQEATVIDGLPIVSKNQIAAGKFLMADMSKSHVRFVMDITVKVGYSGTDFRENRVTFVIEARLHHYISDVEKAAFLYGDFATIKAALETP